MSAIYSIFTSPAHPPLPDHLPTLIVTPHGKPGHILYTYLHTNVNKENYLLTPSDAGDLCVAKLFPPAGGGTRSGSSTNSHGGGGNANSVRCEASRNLRWSIIQSGIQNPIYKLTLPPAPDAPQLEQPLFQVSKPNPNAGWWTLFYFTYAGHLIPPKRIEFGRIQKNSPESGGGTRVAITGKSDEEKAVWKTLGEGNEDMVEWIVLCAALTVLDDEIVQAAERAGLGLTAGPLSTNGRGGTSPTPIRGNQVPTSSYVPSAPLRPPPGPTQQPPPPAPHRRPSAPPANGSYTSQSSQASSGYMPAPASQQRSRSRSPQPPPPIKTAYDPRMGPPLPSPGTMAPSYANGSSGMSYAQSPIYANGAGGPDPRDPRYQQYVAQQQAYGGGAGGLPPPQHAPPRLPSPGPRQDGSTSRQPSTYQPGRPGRPGGAPPMGGAAGKIQQQVEASRQGRGVEEWQQGGRR